MYKKHVGCIFLHRVTQHESVTVAMNSSLKVLHDEFVLIFEKDVMSIDCRSMNGKSKFLEQVPSITSCKAMHENSPVHQPPNPSPGIINSANRSMSLIAYARNPLVLEVEVHSVDNGCTCRHFMGFGFSANMPYYMPGTVVVLPSTAKDGRKVFVTGKSAFHCIHCLQST